MYQFCAVSLKRQSKFRILSNMKILLLLLTLTYFFQILLYPYSEKTSYFHFGSSSLSDRTINSNRLHITHLLQITKRDEYFPKEKPPLIKVV